MPNHQLWIEPEVFTVIEGIPVYYVYEDDDAYNGRKLFRYSFFLDGELEFDIRVHAKSSEDYKTPEGCKQILIRLLQTDELFCESFGVVELGFVRGVPEPLPPKFIWEMGINLTVEADTHEDAIDRAQDAFKSLALKISPRDIYVHSSLISSKYEKAVESLASLAQSAQEVCGTYISQPNTIDNRTSLALALQALVNRMIDGNQRLLADENALNES